MPAARARASGRTTPDATTGSQAAVAARRRGRASAALDRGQADDPGGLLASELLSADGMDVEHQHGHDRTLTQAQREELRRTLEAKREQLLRVLREHEDREEESGEDPLEKEPTDAADLAESAIEDNDRIALADHNLELLEEIDHALSRLDDGTYGLSEASGLPIPYERLRAVPWARYGAEEAERMEQVARGAIGR